MIHSTLKIYYEHCPEYREVGLCADPETTRQFWSTHQLGIEMELKQIDMQN